MLSDLDQGDRARIGPEVAAAARSVEIRSSWSRHIVGLFNFFPMLSLGCFIFYTLAVGLVIVSWIGDGATGTSWPVVLFASLLLVLAVAVVHAAARWFFGLAGRFRRSGSRPDEVWSKPSFRRPISQEQRRRSSSET
ncbi:hypothetical protein AB0K09_24750 [Streptomyces sp. NPDC049577]|uniref:hypothetical protein n=1 Tax=Streptomyces sp. NPDC049577 TaxID=3155153 RepID=UPI003439BA1A